MDVYKISALSAHLVNWVRLFYRKVIFRSATLNVNFSIWRVTKNIECQASLLQRPLNFWRVDKGLRIMTLVNSSLLSARNVIGRKWSTLWIGEVAWELTGSRMRSLGVDCWIVFENTFHKILESLCYAGSYQDILIWNPEVVKTKTGISSRKRDFRFKSKRKLTKNKIRLKVCFC